jgi:hypothetical protein
VAELCGGEVAGTSFEILIFLRARQGGDFQAGMNEDANCCAECGKGGTSLKTCKSCMSVKYCDAACQRNHWPTHKKDCKLRAAELRDVALFKDPPPKEDCPIRFLPMPSKLMHCVSLPPIVCTNLRLFDSKCSARK